MAKFATYPINYPMLSHIDSSGSEVSDGSKHQLTGGWLQAFTEANKILSGSWDGRTLVDGCVNHNSITPWQATIYIDATIDFDGKVTLPRPYFGMLALYDQDLSFVKTIKVEGADFDLILSKGQLLAGTLGGG